MTPTHTASEVLLKFLSYWAAGEIEDGFELKQLAEALITIQSDLLAIIGPDLGGCVLHVDEPSTWCMSGMCLVNGNINETLMAQRKAISKYVGTSELASDKPDVRMDTKLDNGGQ